MTLSTKELDSLIFLLEDPDTDIYNNVRERLVSYGSSVLEKLESTAEFSNNELVNKRVGEILTHIRFEDLQQKFQEWLDFEPGNLLKGLNLICTYNYPGLNFEAVEELIKIVKREVWLELGVSFSPIKTATIFNQVFYDQFGFHITDDYKDRLQHLCINRVLRSKKGEPLALGLIYLVLAEELNIPIHGVILPENQFLLTYAANAFNPGNTGEQYSGDAEFYLNPAQLGMIITEQEVINFLHKNGLDPDLKRYPPRSNVALLQFYLKNFALYFASIGDKAKSEDMKNLCEMCQVSIDSSLKKS